MFIAWGKGSVREFRNSFLENGELLHCRGSGLFSLGSLPPIILIIIYFGNPRAERAKKWAEFALACDAFLAPHPFPVFEAQAIDSAKLFDIMGDQCQFVSPCDSGN